MENSNSIKIGLVIVIILIFIISTITPMVIGHISTITPMVIGHNVNKSTYRELVKNLSNDPVFYHFDKHIFPEGYYSENSAIKIYTDDIKSIISTFSKETTKSSMIETKQEDPSYPITSLDGPMDSPWPMHGHDTHHTGRSPYNTADNTGLEKWRFKTYGLAGCSPAINEDGTIFIGSYDFYAVHPNGTLNWMYDTGGVIESCCPAVDENGVVYVGTAHAAYGNYLYAFFPNGTLKWKYYTGNHITSSPAIGDDGCIYFGDWTGYIHAVYPNGTRKWIYHTGDVVTSSPAIGLDDTIYVGSHDDHVYALYSNNGTVKWKFNTGSWVHGSSTIGADGTVYIGSDNGYLYAFYPNNGTVNWKCNIGSMDASPALDEDGTLYVGVWGERFYAIYFNGTIKWSFDPGNRVWGSSAAISADGLIYFGTCDLEYSGGEDIIALNSDGSEKWRKGIGTLFSSPAIGGDGTIFIGSCHNMYGYLHAFGPLDTNAPSAPIIDGPKSGRPKREYDYTFKSTSPLGRDIYYYIEWGDGQVEDWIGPHPSGEEIRLNHTWKEKGTYTIRARAKDTDNLWGPWSELEVTMPMNQQTTYSLFLQFLERFPRMFPILRLLFNK